MEGGTPRARRRALTRNAILQAAEAIIATQGIAALNMRTVAERINYSAANLYEYFANKEALLDTLIVEAFGRLTAHVRAISSGKTSAQRLVAYGQAYLAFARAHPELYLLIFTRQAPQESVGQGEGGASPLRLLREIIAEGIADGTFLSHPGFGVEAMAFGAWSLVHGMAMLHLTHHAEPENDTLVSEGHILSALTAAMGLPT